MLRWSRAAALSCLLSAGLLCGGCSDKSSSATTDKGGQKRPIQFPVEVQKVEARDVEYAISAVGSVEAFERVLVTARVAGVVEQVKFAEGDTVKDGQVLVEIEPQRYRMAVEVARAQLQRAEVEKNDADSGLKRREALFKKEPGLMREEELTQYRTTLGVKTADVAQARASLSLAELNQTNALVQAPLAGVIQTRTVQTGQYVQAGTTLASLVRREPLLLRFQVPEGDASRLKAGQKATFLVQDATQPYSAEITHVAEFASEDSRMVPIVAKIEDKARSELRPGTFARVSVPVGSSNDAAVIPQTAVRPSERGFLAYVVEGEVAKERLLTLGLRTADGLVEVRSGLKPGERLVIRGAEALRDGAPVRASDAQAESTPQPVAARS
jgi:membrane fusion protein, multidrug efflux system